MYATYATAKAAIVATPAASPSRPSIKFTAFVMATIHIMVTIADIAVPNEKERPKHDRQVKPARRIHAAGENSAGLGREALHE